MKLHYKLLPIIGIFILFSSCQQIRLLKDTNQMWQWYAKGELDKVEQKTIEIKNTLKEIAPEKNKVEFWFALGITYQSLCVTTVEMGKPYVSLSYADTLINSWLKDTLNPNEPDMYEDSILDHPVISMAHHAKILPLRMLGRYQEAKEEYEHIIRTYEGYQHLDWDLKYHDKAIPNTLSKIVTNVVYSGRMQRSKNGMLPFFHYESGLLQEEQGNYEAAEISYRTGLDTLRNQKFRRESEHNILTYSRLLQSMARIASQKEEYDEALNYLEASLEAMGDTINARKAKKDDYKFEWETLQSDFYSNKGQILIKKGEHQEGLNVLQTAVNLKKKSYGDSHPEVAKDQLYVAEALKNIGKLDRSLELVSEVEEAFQFTQDDESTPIESKDLFLVPFTLKILKLRGDIHLDIFKDEQRDNNERITNLNQSIASYKIALDYLKEIQYNFDIDEDWFLSQEAHFDVYEKFIDACSYQHQRAVETKDSNLYDEIIDDIFLSMESSKDYLLQEYLYETGIPDSLTERRVRLQRMKRHLYQISNKSARENSFEDNVRKNQIEKLGQIIREEDSIYRSLKQSLKREQFTIAKEVSKDLDSTQVVVEYFYGKNNLSLLAITQDTIIFQQTPISEIDKKITQILDFVQRYPKAQRDLKSYEEHLHSYILNASELYSDLFPKGIRELLVSKDIDSKLIIIPDGPLGRFPFAALLTEEIDPDLISLSKPSSLRKLKYLIHNTSPRNVYSYAFLKQRYTTDYSKYSWEEPFASFAPLYLADQKVKYNEYFDELRITEKEAQTVSNYFDIQPFIGSSAKLDTFLKIAPSAGIIHLSLHTQISSPPVPDSTFLIFHGDTLDTFPNLTISYENAKLSVSKLRNMELNAFLFVLPGCETGIGKEIRGVGPQSLAWACQLSGVANVLYTLWPSREEMSSNILKDFFDRITNHYQETPVPLATALAQAQKEHLNYLIGENMIKALPYYWACFSFIGQNTNLPKQLINSTYTASARR